MANDYKSSMNLPKTDFPMRAGLAQHEPERLAHWREIDLYGQMLEHRHGAKPFYLHDGPPYANGPMHVGHAFNKILKDIIVKYKTQRGYFAPYVPGWDCHGQPIEHMVETKLGQAKMAETPTPEVRKLCRDWATRYVDVQREGFKRLGVTALWDEPYLTYLPEYEAANVEIFKQMYLDGAIYRGRKPVHWCTHCHTAEAEAEIEYADETSPSIYVDFELVQNNTQASDDTLSRLFTAAGELPVNVLIWTTTPWTIPANVAVCLKDDASYVGLIAGGAVHILAQELLDEVCAAAHIAEEERELLQGADGQPLTFFGRDLVGARYIRPAAELVRVDAEGKSLTGGVAVAGSGPVLPQDPSVPATDASGNLYGVVITGSHVTLDSGTGCVHTAPGHGDDDYKVGLEYGLPMLMPVDDAGDYDQTVTGPIAGMNVWQANQVIPGWLQERGKLFAQRELTHSYPHCWRCHQPVIFRATSQWFVSMEDTGLRTRALEAIEQLGWYPDWSIKRMRSMVEGRPDWCISRQRSWGVPIPVFTCKHCGQTVATPETFDAVIKLFREQGSDAWFTQTPAEYLPADTKCQHCGAALEELEPVRDILDVWWESGVSHTGVLRARDYLDFPADVYLEGSDQHRGWFQSSLLTSVGAYGVAPYKNIISCGFVMDEQGKKMSKSLGNTVDPAKVIDQYGADVLRLWVGSTDYGTDVNIGDEIIKRTSDAYRKIRNTFRFLLSNLYDFQLQNRVQTWDDLQGLDQWALLRLAELLETVTEAYDAYDFHNAYRLAYDYVNELSSNYLDVLKDRLYSAAADSVERRAAQTVLYDILEVLVRIFAPILCFTCDEVWERYPEGLCASGRVGAVALTDWPTLADLQPALPRDGEADQALLDAFAVAFRVRELVTKAMEEAGVKKSQSEAVKIVAAGSDLEALSEIGEAALAELLIVSQVVLEELPDGSETKVALSAAVGEKCPRCWNIREIGADPAHPDLCARCAAVVSAL
ncbi:MAG: isoleucine--tRNA ligase [Coriobacteriales bacterium]|jgi:isoleucyl-tRNA synthetase|nr:isoleucine--tRNA ligase [Coriobacteriales bacterium]